MEPIEPIPRAVDIASRLGVSKQAVHQKHGPRSRPGRGE